MYPAAFRLKCGATKTQEHADVSRATEADTAASGIKGAVSQLFPPTRHCLQMWFYCRTMSWTCPLAMGPSQPFCTSQCPGQVQPGTACEKRDRGGLASFLPRAEIMDPGVRGQQDPAPPPPSPVTCVRPLLSELPALLRTVAPQKGLPRGLQAD